MMTSRRSDRFVLMMSVSIFAVSEMTASLRDSGVGAFLELVFGDQMGSRSGARTSCAKVVRTRAQWMQKGSKDTQTPLLQVD
jgi:hypothetical protein